MSEPAPYVFPELSVEQKFAVREAYYTLAKVREKSAADVKNAEQAVVSVINGLVATLQIPPNSNFDLDTLKFSAKQ